MIVKKIGSSYLVVFPSPPAKSTNPAGMVTIGQTITILYALKIIHGQARFISVDESELPKDIISKINVDVKSGRSDANFGFMVRDAKQPTLDIHVAPTFMAEVKNNVRSLQQKMAREGNLNVTIAPDKDGIKIIHLWLD